VLCFLNISPSSFLGGDVQCRVQVLGGGVHLSAVLEEEHHDVHVSQPRGDVQWRLLLPGTGVHLGAIAQQDANDVGLERVRWNSKERYISIYR